jgi:hypothetical protein
MLLFKKKFLDAIRTGRKTQTVRVWKRRYVRAGQLSYTPGVGKIRIVSIDEVALDELDEQDALRDGFDDVEQLVAEIQNLYAERLENGYRVFRIRFEKADDVAVQRPTES